MCTNNDIQELLPSYREQALGPEDQARVERHLAECGDCRAELDLLGMLAADPVPDPGEAFWSALPEKVHRQVLKDRERMRPWWDLRVPVSISLPRWAWAAAAVLFLTAVSWLAVRPAPVRIARVTSPVRGDLRTALIPADVLDLADLSDMDIDAVDLWATEELAFLQDDLLEVMRNNADLGLDERLAELTAEELETLSRMLDSQNEEG